MERAKCESGLSGGRRNRDSWRSARAPDDRPKLLKMLYEPSLGVRAIPVELDLRLIQANINQGRPHAVLLLGSTRAALEIAETAYLNR